MTGEGWTQYKLRQKMFSIGEDFWIENERGEAVYKVDGKVLTLRETFVLEDGSGAELATIEAKLLAWTPTMNIKRGGQVYATVSKVPFTFLHDRYTIQVQGGPAYEAEGDITDHEYEIRTGVQPVATISKRWFALTDTFGIAIAPGQDDPLLLCAAVVIDELEEREHRRH